MNRLLALSLAATSLCFGQNTNPSDTFLSEVNKLPSRVLDGRPVPPASIVQQELRFSTPSAEALVATAREYALGKAVIERGLKRAIFERRMQVMAGGTISLAPEPELIAESARRANTLLAQKMSELKDRVGEVNFDQLARYIESYSAEGYFPLRVGEATITVVRN